MIALASAVVLILSVIDAIPSRSSDVLRYVHEGHSRGKVILT